MAIFTKIVGVFHKLLSIYPNFKETIACEKTFFEAFFALFFNVGMPDRSYTLFGCENGMEVTKKRQKKKNLTSIKKDKKVLDK